MTIKEFAKKYGISVVRLRAALDLGKLRRNGSAGLNYENKTQYQEEDMMTAWYAYLMEDMRACIDRAAQDNQLLKDFVKKSAEKN